MTVGGGGPLPIHTPSYVVPPLVLKQGIRCQEIHFSRCQDFYFAARKKILTQLWPAGPCEKNPDTAQPSWPCENKILTQLSPAGHAKKNPDTAPEPGQDHTKSHEITLQVHFTTSTVLRKILTLPWAKNPDTAAGPILRKKILTQLS